MEPTTRAELTAAIGAADVAHHPIPSADVPAVIGAVAERLAQLGAEDEVAPVGPEPAVPVRRSVAPEHPTRLACGPRVQTLQRHPRVAHGPTPVAYRGAFGLKRDHPLAFVCSAAPVQPPACCAWRARRAARLRRMAS